MKKLISALLCAAILTSATVMGSVSAQEEQKYTGTIDDYTVSAAQKADEIPLKTGDAAVSNIALNKAVTVSDSEQGNNTDNPQYITDGNDSDSSRWASVANMKNGQNANATDLNNPKTVTIDLGRGKAASDVESIVIKFHALVWARTYTISTSSNGTDWTEIYSCDRASANVRDVVDTLAYDADLSQNTLKRYVRFNFTRINLNAGGSGVSVKEIEINGVLVDSDEDTEAPPANAAAAMGEIASLRLDSTESRIIFPDVHSNYEFSLKGVDFENIIDTNGEVAPYLIGDHTVNIVAQIVSKSNPADKAEKSFTITVHDKSGNFPQLFPAVNNPNKKPGVIPAVAEWYGYNGKFTPTAQSSIVYNDAANAEIASVAQAMSDDLYDMLGIRLAVKSGTTAGAKDIYLESLTSDSYKVGDEGNVLIVNDNGMKIYAPTRTGVLYGTYTALQGIITGDGSFPYGVVRDYPEFRVRGVMIDAARSPFRFETLQKYQKMLSWFKINEMHMHINDDRHQTNSDRPNYSDWVNVESMFRLESEVFPSLTTTAKNSDYFNAADGYGGTPTYTKEQWRDFQQTGAALGLNVITEIDLPAHALAFTAYVHNHPQEAAAAGITGEVQSSRHWELMALTGNNYENSRRFMNALYGEYINGVNGGEPTFTADTVHIGADEYWNITAAEKVGFKNYVDDISAMVKATGKKVRMWGGVSYFLDNSAAYSDIELDLWATNYENVANRIAQGYSLVNVCNNYLYNNALRDNRDVINVEHLYESWNPYVFSSGAVKRGEPAVIGAKAAIWQDVTDMGVTEQDNTERILRAAAVVAEKTWGGTGSQTYEQFSLILSRVKDGAQGAENASSAATSYCIADLDFSNASGDKVYNAADGSTAQASGVTYETDANGETWAVFNGNSEISTGIKSISYPYTVSFDIRANSNNTASARLFSGTEGRLNAAGMSGQMSISRAFFDQSLGYTLPTNNAAHITVVGTQEAVKLYVNGNLVKFLGRATASETDYAHLSSTFVFPLEYIGSGFKGKMANIRVYSKALSPETIQAIAQGGDVSYVNVAQNKGVAGDAQNVGLGGWDTGWKKLRVGWKAVDGDSNALNGRYDTTVSEKDSCFQGAHADSYIVLDLWRDYDISKIVLQWDSTPTSFKLQKSNDGVNWTDIQTFTAASAAASVTNLELSTPITTRYLKMQGVSIANNTNFVLREFMAFEKVNKTALTMYSASYKTYCDKLGIASDSQQRLVATKADSILANPVAEQFGINNAVDAVKAAAEQFPAGTIVSGDVNFDGKMNVKDATLIQKHTAELVAAENVNAFTADVNGDGAINGLDTTLLQKCLVHLAEMP